MNTSLCDSFWLCDINRCTGKATFGTDGTSGQVRARCGYESSLLSWLHSIVICLCAPGKVINYRVDQGQPEQIMRYVNVNADVCANRVLLHRSSGSLCKGRTFHLSCIEGAKRRKRSRISVGWKFQQQFQVVQDEMRWESQVSNKTKSLQPCYEVV